jgi:hypothetical protein
MPARKGAINSGNLQSRSQVREMITQWKLAVTAKRDEPLPDLFGKAQEDPRVRRELTK